MANIFVSGDELANKKDVDSVNSKINVDTNLFKLNQNDPVNVSDFSAQIPYPANNSVGRLQVIHQRTNNVGKDTYGQFDTLLVFGGDDGFNALDVKLQSQGARIMNSKWNGELAFKSDIDALKARIDALEKQIGGGTK